MTRVAAREIVVHMVYALDFSQGMPDLVGERTSPGFFEGLAEEDELFGTPPDGDSGQYIKSVAEGVNAHLAELDGYIEKYASGWSFGRISRVAVAVMRVCMYEMLYRPDVPDAAAINAAVEICKRYEGTETVAFVNGILGTFSREGMV
ncbi:MAG: transcription antitermination factor NusB [Oscillospiraceae bacterium]|jgi:N utilization substance protein B|nr:transcription antitermination factor NusB [Oscillospiraceae bacterium]